MARSIVVPLTAQQRYAEAAALAVGIRAGEVFQRAESALDLGDIEAVHDMRVATRRLRAALEIFAPCFPAKRHTTVLRDVKRLADALGERRDRDVRLEELGELATKLGVHKAEGVASLLARLRAEQATANLRLAAALDEVRASELARRLVELSERAR